MASLNRRCPYCGTEASIAAQFCAQCGARFPLTPPELSPYACEKCETPLPSGSRFCPGCGQAFDEPVPTVTPPNPGFRPQSVPPEPVATTLSQPQPVPILVQLKMPSFSNGCGPRVNYGWFREALQLFQANAGVWIVATLAYLVPFAIDYWVASIFGRVSLPGDYTSLAYYRAVKSAEKSSEVAQGLVSLPLLIVLCRLNCATYRMANKQVLGRRLTYADIWQGGSGIAPVFCLTLLMYVGVMAGITVFVVPGLLLLALASPAYALAAEGVGVFEALQRSIAAMKQDWLNATVVAVLCWLLLLVSMLLCGLGLLITYPLYKLIVALACRDMIGMPEVLEPAPAQRSITALPAYVPKPNGQTEAALPQKAVGAAPSVLGNVFATRGTVIGIGSLVAVLCLGAGFWFFHLAHPSAPAKAVNTSSSVMPVSDNAPNPPDVPTSSGETVFPVHWGPYTITRVNGIDQSGTSSQKARISSAAGVTLWESDSVESVSALECGITGSAEKELEVTAFSGGSSGSGTSYYFSRSNGLRLLFSYDFGDGDDITGFTKYDTNSRPRVQVDHSIVDFDGLAHGQRQVYSCVYTWDGKNYVNATAKFPQDARTAENDAQARYLHHWQENPTADFNGINEDIEGGDSADREDAIGYWANAMAVGDGDAAKNWLLAHANPRLASHLQQIEGDLRKEIPQEGAKLDIKMGDGTNLDQPAANGSSMSSAADNRTTSDKAIILPRSRLSEERDPLKETAAPGSGLTDQLLDLNTLQHRIVTDEDLSGRSLAALSISYNAIYAAHGYIFKRPSLQQIFSRLPWYAPNPAFHEQDLSSIEQANLKTIRGYERAHFEF